MRADSREPCPFKAACSRWLNKNRFLHQQEASRCAISNRPHHLLSQPRVPSSFGLTAYFAVCLGRSLSVPLRVLVRPVASSAQRWNSASPWGMHKPSTI